jgi:hypothetical protein
VGYSAATGSYVSKPNCVVACRPSAFLSFFVFASSFISLMVLARIEKRGREKKAETFGPSVASPD